MNALLQAAIEIQQFLRNAGENFCFIGGVALQRWGEPRFTRDVDLTLLCPYGAEAIPVEKLVAAFSPRIPDASAFAQQHRVLLLRSATGIPMDIALGAIPFEERCVARATEFDFGGASLLTCSAEDLVVLKAFAARDRDWADIESIAARQVKRLDWPLVFQELSPLAELREESRAMERLSALMEKYR
jgi:Nucleotidyl transferase AbiEii toxin, Type IV TA system